MRNVTDLLSGAGNKIPLFKVFMSEEAISNATGVLNSGFVGQGPSVEEFEKQLKPYVGENVLTLNSGTSALQLALFLSGVKNGSSVITTPMTCTATNTAILDRQAKIIFADVNAKDGNINVDDVLYMLKTGIKAKAVMVVSWGGYPPDLERLYNITREYDTVLIHDAAHAFGARIDEHLISEFADFTCFSFQAIKHLTTVDGGALVCKDKEQYKRGKLLRWYGLDREGKSDFRCAQNVKEAGFKYHMNDLNASIGLGNLKYIDWILERHISNANEITKGIEGCNKVGVIPNDSSRSNQYWVLTILVDEVDKFISFLDTNGINASRVHARNDKHECFTTSRNLFGLTEFYSHQVSIPCGWWLSKEDIEKIVLTIRRYCDGVH